MHTNSFRTTIGISVLTVVLAFISALSGFAQGEGGMLGQMSDDERTAAEAVALYPRAQREAILEVASHPELVVRMRQLRARTEEEFRTLLDPLPEARQREVYDISRYPDLVRDLTANKRRPSAGLRNELLAEYPENVRKAAESVVRSDYEVLRAIDGLYRVSETEFEVMISGYPRLTKEAATELVRMPEVLDVMAENMSMTVLLGDVYRRDPDGLQDELDSLGVVLAERQAKELQDWKRQLEEDPEAMAEYQAASKEFAREQGYSEEEYTRPAEVNYRTDVHVHHVWRPYVYWFGTPWWYTYDCWYPYPWWYHWGYYYGPRGGMVIVGMPSWHYVNWHFNYYDHFYYYPRFTDRMITHHYRHRESPSSLSSGVGNWVSTSDDRVPREFIAKPEGRVARIKEYGKFQMDYQEQVAQSTGKVPTPREYLKKNAEAYPAMRPILKEPEPVSARPAEPKPRTFERQPVKAEPRQVKPDVSLERPPVYEPKPRVEPDRRPDPRTIDRARDFHQNTWERVTPERKQIRPPVRQREVRPTLRSPAQRSVSPKSNIKRK